LLLSSTEEEEEETARKITLTTSHATKFVSTLIDTAPQINEGIRKRTMAMAREEEFYIY